MKIFVLQQKFQLTRIQLREKINTVMRNANNNSIQRIAKQDKNVWNNEDRP